MPPPAPTFADIATQAYAFDPPTTQSYPFDDSFRGATDLLGAQPVGLPELRDEGLRPRASGSAIDALFGESQFREYETGVLASEGFAAPTQLREREPREPLGTAQKVLLWVAGGLVAALALVGLFMVGTQLSALIPPPPVAAEPTVAPVVVDAQPPAVGPVAPGDYAWSELLGGECVDPFVSAWQEQYTVVDCAAPHAAQLVFHGYFGDEAYAPYPGEAVLQSRINLLCTSPKSVSYSLASQFSDIQVAASYAVTAADWDAGQRDFYCFVSRSSAEPFTASVANAVVPSETLAPTIPGNDP